LRAIAVDTVQEFAMTRAAKAKSPSNLQRQLANQILRYIRNNNLAPGAPLPEVPLAEEFKVSRTPVRAALERLAAQGVVDATSRRGYAVGQRVEELAAAAVDADESDDDALYMQITTDFVEESLDAQFSEADLMRRYKVRHGLLNRVLQRMAADLVIERNPGHGWRFAPAFKSEEAERVSYRFRMMIEPAGLLEPGYTLDRARAQQVRRDHEAIIATPRNKLSRIRIFNFYDMNAEFHELLAAGSGNSFLLQAVQQQNRLRRLLVYNWTYPLERIVESCVEHMELLTAVEKGEMEWAATLMRRHLELAARVASEADAAHAKSGSAQKKKR
jgi:DNA-binding GntR family transcriptional regulator